MISLFSLISFTIVYLVGLHFLNVSAKTFIFIYNFLDGNIMLLFTLLDFNVYERSNGKYFYILFNLSVFCPRYGCINILNMLWFTLYQQ